MVGLAFTRRTEAVTNERSASVLEVRPLQGRYKFKIGILCVKSEGVR